MQLKKYQQAAYDVLAKYVDFLRVSFENTEKMLATLRAANIEISPALLDFPSDAWKKAASAGLLPDSSYVVDGDGARLPRPYTAHQDGTSQPVPSICLKVPTGGGKTLLGVWGAGAIMQRYLQSNRGVLLWIVPNEAIYAQTRKQLIDRDHPYRQALDRVAAGADRVVILDKDDPLNAADVKEHLCVMLLMLQAANRESKETLRMFRDRGNVHGFFPSEGDPLAHIEILNRVKNLDVYGDGHSVGTLIKDSLGNVLRMVRPIVVLDEGHKAYSQLALRTLYGFNPSFVLELSATPNSAANRLVDVSGKDLESEEMIKLPINVDVKADVDWKKCLLAAWGKLQELQRAAETFRANTGRYIRPIMLVQVERTGREQREARYVHALDVRDFLLSVGLNEVEIAIKTAEVNELKSDDNQDLLAPTNRVRVIITKQALQEGWDCPFAYVLCSLAANRNLSAMTQLVGRVLRQPQAQKTGIPPLDQAYVFCHHVETGDVVDGIRQSLESDGMGDLAGRIQTGSGSGSRSGAVRMIPRRDEFRSLRIFLPRVLFVSDDVRDLDFDADIISRLEWSSVDVEAIANAIAPSTHAAAGHRLQLGLDVLSDAGRAAIASNQVSEVLRFDTVYATRVVTDIVGNPWIARVLVGRLLTTLRTRGFSDGDLGNAMGYVLDEFRKGLEAVQDRMAHSVFTELVAEGKIQFRLKADAFNWEMSFEIPTTLPTNAKLLYQSSDAKPVQKSLFAPIYEADFNSLEAEFACYLDGEAALNWWFRNVARRSYGLQGWRKNKVYPDFIFGMNPESGSHRLFVIETKGDHLAGLDTKYKRELLDLLTANYGVDLMSKGQGELELVIDPKTTVRCALIFGDHWRTELHEQIDPAVAARKVS